MQTKGFWVAPKEECSDVGHLDQGDIPRSNWEQCAWHRDFTKTSDKEWPCRGEWPEDDSKLRLGYLQVGIPEGSKQVKADAQCSPEPCRCPSMNLNTKSARAEARKGFRWNGENGCTYRDFKRAEVQQCLRDQPLTWLKHYDVPPTVLQDLRVRYDVDTKSMDDRRKSSSIPTIQPDNGAFVVETAGFFHTGEEKDHVTLRQRIEKELLGPEWTHGKGNRGHLIFLLSPAHHEWDSAQQMSLAQQEAYNAVLVETLKDTAWVVVDGFSSTKGRPQVTRTSEMAWEGRSGDGILFAGVTKPLLHEHCNKYV